MRAWDVNGRTMCNVLHLIVEQDRAVFLLQDMGKPSNAPKFLICPGECIPMLSIGQRKDMDGNSLYEGDIVRADGTCWELCYNEEDCYFGMRRMHMNGSWEWMPIDKRCRMRKVGNIHENPEMMRLRSCEDL